MVNPWNDTACFDAMFCDTVEINATRSKGSSLRGTYSACVYPPQREEAFAECDAESDLRSFTFLLTKRGEHAWNKPTPPQIGDGVKLANGTRWKVSSVEDRIEWYEVVAKSC